MHHKSHVNESDIKTMSPDEEEIDSFTRVYIKGNCFQAVLANYKGDHSIDRAL